MGTFQALAIRRQFAESAGVAGRHLGVAVELLAGGSKTFQLCVARVHRAVANLGRAFPTSQNMRAIGAPGGWAHAVLHRLVFHLPTLRIRGQRWL